MLRRRRNRSKRIERDLLRGIDQAENQHGDRHGRDRAMKYRHRRSLSQVLPQDDNREREESAKPAAHYLAQRIRARHSVNSETRNFGAIAVAIKCLPKSDISFVPSVGLRSVLR
jgi:hypothetical protein